MVINHMHMLGVAELVIRISELPTHARGDEMGFGGHRLT